MALISLDTLATYWKNVSDWVKGTDAVSAPAVKLTGRNVELVSTIMNAKVIVDTNNFFAPAISRTDLAKYKELFIKVKNNLKDATGTAVVTTLKISDNGIGFTPAQNVTVTDANGAVQMLDKDKASSLQVGGFISLMVGVQCSGTAPTQGTITVELYGIPN